MSSREHPDEPFDDIEAELTALGNLLDVPGPPPPSELAAAVRARLEQPAEAPADSHDAVRARPDQPVQPSDDPHHAGGPDPAHGPVTGPVRPPGRRDSRAPARRRRRARWAIVAAVVVVVITVTAATPQGRAAVTQILRLAGIEIEVGPTAPPPVTTTATLPGEHQVPRRTSRAGPGSRCGPRRRSATRNASRWPTTAGWCRCSGRAASGSTSSTAPCPRSSSRSWARPAPSTPG
ncbi:hypothetical protein ACFQ0B_05310 [Nonomuraea thailandensis]